MMSAVHTSKVHCVGKRKEKEKNVGFLWPVASGLPVSKLCPRAGKQAATPSVILGSIPLEMQNLRLSAMEAESAFDQYTQVIHSTLKFENCQCRHVVVNTDSN